MPSAQKLKSELVSIKVPHFNLALTIESGQVFHWLPEGTGWVGSIGKLPVYIEQREGTLWVTKGTQAHVAEYFSLGHPLPEIYKTFPKDPAMTAALDFCAGITVMQQPFWECIATFITSSMKQVPHIRQMSLALRKNFGSPISASGFELYAYPTPEQLSTATEGDLRACKLGFRAKNLLGAARMVASGEVDLRRIREMEDEAALLELCRLSGVGEKVANCVLLFAYARYKAFPIDVWIERVLREIYFRGKRKVTGKRMKRFTQEYFGPYGGYAQQYLFHHARKTYRLASKS